ncbi:MAG: preprotein translocase subunit YajC [bacterium]
MNTLMMMAQAGAPAQQGGLAGMGSMLLPMVLVFGIFYFMMIRPQQRKEKERMKTISELRAGQRIIFGGGLIGTVTEVREHTFMVELSSKVSVEIVRAAVSRVLQNDEKPVLDDRK